MDGHSASHFLHHTHQDCNRKCSKWALSHDQISFPTITVWFVCPIREPSCPNNTRQWLLVGGGRGHGCTGHVLHDGSGPRWRNRQHDLPCPPVAHQWAPVPCHGWEGNETEERGHVQFLRLQRPSRSLYPCKGEIKVSSVSTDSSGVWC